MIMAGSIAQNSAADACAFVDKVLGKPSAWQSPLMAYRLSAGFQADWKCEVGRWLLFADSAGFLPELVKGIDRARQLPSSPRFGPGQRDPNDDAHAILHQEIAPAEVAYYLSTSGWSFVSIPAPNPAAGCDVDLRMCTRTGVLADIQIKASDRPGRIVGHRRFEGEIDEHVRIGVRKAVGQIAGAPGPLRMVVTCPQRTWPMSRESGPIASLMVGRTIGESGGRVTLDPGERGLFAQEDGAKVHAVAILDFFRPVDEERYGCTVFLNPWPSDGRRLSPDEFPSAAVCELTDNRFRWHGDPGESHVIPSGAEYLAARAA
jgi:hypothetical protein